MLRGGDLMYLVILGPPGAGKGTQAKFLSEKLNIPHISTGDIFREAIREKTPLGVKANRYIEKGELVPDEVTVGMIKERIGREDCQKGFLLDGFPRTVAQAEALEKILKEKGLSLDGVIALYVPDEVILERLTFRRSCPQCGRVYHLKYNPPLKEGVCDKCGIPLVHREDDKEEVIMNRLKVYYEKTNPLIDFYKKRGILIEIDGRGAIEEIAKSILEVLGKG